MEWLTPWYQISKAELVQNSQQVYTQGKIYGFKTGYVYTQNVQEKTGIFKIKNNSVYLFNGNERKSPVKVIITGACSNPYWEVFNDGELVGNDGFSINLEDGQTLEVSSLFQDRTALLYDAEGNISSVYQQQDQTKSNFVHVPVGESSIVFHTGNASVIVEVYEESDAF